MNKLYNGQALAYNDMRNWLYAEVFFLKENQAAWPVGMKKTKQRVCVYSVLEQADAPLSAAEIYRQIDRAGLEISLSTVYRILEFFVKEDIALKTMILDNDMAVYIFNRNQHKHYAVCMNCHKVIELENCPLENFVPKLADGEFHVLGHRLELYGYCKDCEEKRNS